MPLKVNRETGLSNGRTFVGRAKHTNCRRGKTMGVLHTPRGPDARPTLRTPGFINPGFIINNISSNIVPFSGADPGVGPGGLCPGLDATAAGFVASSSTSLITFEAAPIGNFTTLTVAPGVTATLAGTDLITSIQAILS